MSLLGFVTFMSIGLLGYIFRSGTPKQNLPFPIIKLDYLDPAPQQIEQWWAAHFGGKDWLAERYDDLHPHLEVLSPLPDKVLIGQAGWLFHAEKTLDQYRGAERFSPYELSVLRSKLQKRAQQYQERGARFYLFVVPAKAAVYPEYLPPHVQAGKLPSQAEQTTQLINELPNAEAHYLLPKLLSEKQMGRLYDKTDSHWNDRGAFAAYQYITQQLALDFPAITQPKSHEDFKEYLFEDNGRNLARMMNLAYRFKEEAVGWKDQTPTKATAFMPYEVQAPHDFVFADQYLLAYQNTESRGPKVLFIRDSFSTQLLPWLAEHFGESFFLWDKWRYGSNLPIVDQIQPEAVVVIMLEEHLRNLLRWP